MSKEKLSFEEASAKLDEIVRQLERGDCPLDKSLALFEEGVGLIKICSAMLEKAEQKVTILQKSNETDSVKEIIFDDDD